MGQKLIIYHWLLFIAKLTDLVGQAPESGSWLARLENGAQDGESTQSGRQQVILGPKTSKI